MERREKFSSSLLFGVVSLRSRAILRHSVCSGSVYVFHSIIGIVAS